MTAPAPSRRASLAHMLGRLRRNRSGVAMLEFALGTPLVLGMGMYCLETANLALVNLRISQIALNLADNASRVGYDSNLSTQQLREVDINDVLQGARYQGKALKLTTYGRVTVSSLEYIKQSYDTAPVQRVHWQRCIGQKMGSDYASVVSTSPTAGTDASEANAGTKVSGMGDPGTTPVSPPSDSGLIYVEINYQYQPLVSKYLTTGTTRIHYVASFIVRDNRDYSRVFNPQPMAVVSSCNLASS